MTGAVRPGQLVVHYAPGALNTGLLSLSAPIPPVRIGKSWMALHEADEESKEDAKDRYRQMPGVLYVEENHEVRYLFTPNDTYFPGNSQYASSRSGLVDQWGLARIDAPKAWDLTRQRAGNIVIAIVDTGVDPNHPDLKNRIALGSDGKPLGFSFVDGTADITDDNGHGTHCSGIASAETNNAAGVAGVAFATAKIMPVKVLDAEGSGSDFGVAQGIIWAADHGANIISMSLGSSGYSHSIQLAINYAWTKGALIIAAAGNDGMPIVSYPAGCNLVLGVGSTEEDGTRSDFSNFARQVDCAAPGSDYLSTMPTYPVYLTRQLGFKQNYDALSGTSMATPVVSGLAALLWATYPGATNGQIRTLLSQTSRKLTAGERGWSPEDGWGEVKASDALYKVRVQSGLGCITGQVVNATGLPVADAAVSTGGVSATTDESGGFRLANLPAGMGYSVTAVTRQVGTRAVTAKVVVPDNADADITMVLK